MDFTVIQTAEGLPNGCTLCHTFEGPFVLIPGVQHFDVPTAEGLATIEAPLAFCVGRDDPTNPAVQDLGCARLLGKAAGCTTPSERQGLEEHARAALARAEELHHEVEGLQAAVAEARANAVQVVPVSELQKILAGDTSAPAAG